MFVRRATVYPEELTSRPIVTTGPTSRPRRTPFLVFVLSRDRRRGRQPGRGRRPSVTTPSGRSAGWRAPPAWAIQVAPLRLRARAAPDARRGRRRWRSSAASIWRRGSATERRRPRAWRGALGLRWAACVFDGRGALVSVSTMKPPGVQATAALGRLLGHGAWRVIVVWGASRRPAGRPGSGGRSRAGADVVHLDDCALDGARYDLTLGAAARPGGWRSSGRRIRLDEIDGLYLRPGPPQHGAAARAAAASAARGGGVDRRRRRQPPAGRALEPVEAVSARCHQERRLRGAAHDRHHGPGRGPGVPRPARAHRVQVDQRRAQHRRDARRRRGRAPLGRVGHRARPAAAWIDGIDVRVHVVGTRWFATAIESAAADYRYAAEGGHEVKIARDPHRRRARPAACRARGRHGTARRRDRPAAHPGRTSGICFEVNPSPGFTFYEDAGGQPIAAAIAGLLRSAIR